ncbi:MAG: outer membrane protein assembly factor BamA, partial [Alphaproteobacteria bacterium]|nr:outer membrane protein assembly factor BamA [Alphaproteobacteria bacterium]MDX5368321.1 outer membrane protein assembly factor BamA [Alphaproteobacteria bacterium]MDX5463116.1 outer membrane protein assembly factor BamA [Alphaproteobacteria bacterium]
MVTGNQRIEEATVRSYMALSPGDPITPARIDQSLKTLFNTGLFADVSIRQDGASLIVSVVENPIVNRVAFEGNDALDDEELRVETQLRPRVVFT